MSHGPKLTRRTALQTLGAGLAAAGVSAGTALADDGWTVAETPTSNTLHDVEYTAAGAYAVGGDGVVIERTADGWRKVLDGGPTGNGSNLYDADVTEDGERLWFVGASGAVGEYDVTTGSLMTYTELLDSTNNYNDVAVTGSAGEANVYVAGDSGTIYYSFENGRAGTWERATPGSGSNINAIDFRDDRAGHAVDGNRTVFETDDGVTWNRIGVPDANHDFYAVDSSDDDVRVAGDGGTIFYWNGVRWTPIDTGDARLNDIEVDDDAGLVVGSGATVFDLADGRWLRAATPTGQNLKSVVRGDPDITVGAGGTVIER
ncbi:MAG: hypothetical protein ABEJ79_11460 [Halolamina sp.]